MLRRKEWNIHPLDSALLVLIQCCRDNSGGAYPMPNIRRIRRQ